MQQQPLAFTLVKTVVRARDNGKVLSPALATAWDLLRTELSPAHRVIASEVSWSPSHQEDLKFVIEGIRKQFEKDPELENEFLAFLAEVEPFGEGDKEATIFPTLTAISASAALPTDAHEVSPELELEKIDVSRPTTTEGNLEESNDQMVEQLNDATTLEPPVELDLTPSGSKSLIPVVEESIVEEARSFEVEEQISAIEPTTPKKQIAESTTSSLNFWPLVIGASLLVIVAGGIWALNNTSSSKPITSKVQTEKFVPPADSTAEDATDFVPQLEDKVTYSAPSVELLSLTVDSLRQSGDYETALSTQLQIAQLLEKEGRSSKETAQAYSELAILYAAQNNVLQSIVEQRKSLSFARQAFEATDPSLGRSHLKLASFYSDNGELHMARAHLQQARKIFGQAQELVSPTDIESSKQIAEKILKAS